MSHLQYAGRSEAEQRQGLKDIILSEPLLMEVLEGLRTLRLSDSWLVAGAIYNIVWNRLTGQPSLHGVKDIDLFYCDARDLSYEAEDREIQRAATVFAHLPLPVELRNQARVHLWFPEKFGVEVAPLVSSEESLLRYASKTHAVAARLDERGALQIAAPFGLDDLFSFRIVPNPVIDNKVAHTAKAARAKRHWPQLTVVPWPE